MNKSRFLRLFCCFFCFGCLLYNYINKQNMITKLRLDIPSLWTNLRTLEQENVALNFLINKIERPDHLMEIADLPEYQYLEYPKDERVHIMFYESS
ncbi:hypothetical protein [Chlamydia sp. 17-3921]|uniref:hypothetical protein n=1 Tax=Chlamydia sp. 17-3921 TaxID=2675798 RepID=UPI00191B44FA|nr:hypothetical protein [Chlamydia sp. 17-3921]